MSRLKRLKDTKATTTLFDRQYEYNTANQIWRIIEPSQTRTFGYDDANRLTSVLNGTTTIESYDYDAVGNRTSSHFSGMYSYQPFNQLTETETGVYSYDANGNLSEDHASPTVLTTYGGTTYSWDYENRLTGASKLMNGLATGANYEYDALGRRVSRSVTGQFPSTFTYDGADVLLDQSPNGRFGTSTTKYLNAAGIDNKLRQTANGQTSYFLSDHLGSTTALVNSTGTITSQSEYDSFGNVTNNGVSSRYQFTGREFDSFSGLSYYRARWYSAELGRFISEDPIGFRGGNNWYSYVDNNPITSIDPYGLDPYKLPANPGTNGSNLPPGWRNIPEHRDPNNPGLERWVSPSGDEGLEYHPGKSGEPGFEGQDHWHKLNPKSGRNDRWEKDESGGRKGGHYLPGDEVDLQNCESPAPPEPTPFIPIYLPPPSWLPPWIRIPALGFPVLPIFINPCLDPSFPGCGINQEQII